MYYIYIYIYTVHNTNKTTGNKNCGPQLHYHFLGDITVLDPVPENMFLCFMCRGISEPTFPGAHTGPPFDKPEHTGASCVNSHRMLAPQCLDICSVCSCIGSCLALRASVYTRYPIGFAINMYRFGIHLVSEPMGSPPPNGINLCFVVGI